MSERIRVPLPLTGGCSCGALRYEVTTLPLMLYVCHCTECRRQSTAAFGMSMPVVKDGFRITRGEPAFCERTAESGRIVKAAFCARCGVRVLHMPARNEAVVNVKPGTLDDPSWVRPTAHLWTRSKLPWVVIPDGMLQFEQQPSEFGALRDAWLAVVEK